MIDIVDIGTSRVGEIPRHKGDGRPKIFPEDGGKGSFYTRCTTFVDCLDDKTNLSGWKMRKVAQGLALRPDLMERVLAFKDPDGEDKQALGRVCKLATDAADADLKSSLGTALHKCTERYDETGRIGSIPPEFEKDMEAYIEATKDLEMVSIETFVVQDDYKVGGTFDRLVMHEGRLKIADLKTGRVDYGMNKIAMQLAMYAHSRLYDPVTFKRTSIGEVDLTEAVVINAPVGTGTCELIRVPIQEAWEQGIVLAKGVREWRKVKLATESLVRVAA